MTIGVPFDLSHDANRRTVAWTPLEGESNARASGQRSITSRQGVVEPIVRNENAEPIEQHVANGIERFGGEL